ncbi:MAG: hypothetical protein KC964_14280, partial [Candidatus Omnitrophica bacterium]|nr:hypothetical protein [Candidatus Omnitrophota bacterium]
TTKRFVFHQDAFGNEVDAGVFSSSSWATARGRDYRITEHQTGKDYDEFTGLYYFHARWYDAEVGRFLGREPILASRKIVADLTTAPAYYHPYHFCTSMPSMAVDINGKFSLVSGIIGAGLGCLIDGGISVINGGSYSDAGCSCLGGMISGGLIGIAPFGPWGACGAGAIGAGVSAVCSALTNEDFCWEAAGLGAFFGCGGGFAGKLVDDELVSFLSGLDVSLAAALASKGCGCN